MNRVQHLVDDAIWSLALPVAVLLSGCGVAEPTERGPGPNGNTAGTDQGSGGGSGGNNTGSGGNNTGSGGNNTGSGGNNTGSGGNNTGGSSAGAGGSAGGGAPPPPPPPADGIQIATPEFVLRPGEEKFKCYHVDVPMDTEINISRFVSNMAKGSHHFILYQAPTASAPSGTLDDRGCSGGLNAQWVYASSSVDNELRMPPSVAMPFKARQPLTFDMHYINTGKTDLNARVTLNLEYAKGTFEKAGSLISFNTQIRIPANGQQTVSDLLAIPPGAKFFSMSTHTHKYATLATIHRYANGQAGEELVHTTDWEHPDVGSWATPYLTFAPGQQIQMSCTYTNTTAAVVPVGQSAEKNEMCMAVGYYFPRL